MSRWCHHLKGPCPQDCGSECIPRGGLLVRPDDPLRGRWDVPPGFEIVVGIMALLGIWAILLIVWMYTRWPSLWS